MTESIRRQILAMAHSLGALTFGDFVLSSGQRSSYYFDGRLLTLDPRGAYLVSKALTPIVLDHGAEAVGGPTLGADPMVGAIVLTSYMEDKPLRGFLVRSEAKGHGTGRLIEGPIQRGNAAGPEVLAGINPEDSPELGPVKVAILDDACSTGGSLLHAIDAVEAAGCRVVCVAVVLDRHQGGSEKVRRRGYPFVTLLEADAEGAIRVAA